ncbi:hypothetical protein IM511_06335 [Erythrobacteraceae bacterium E2-1 Yellow Sea]|nr:hypothetical protein [Erythrobacteraceae bacterium E2-1 Yellow Sea]
MAKARTRKTTGPRSRRGKWLALIVLVLVAGVAWAYRAPAFGFAHAATSYSARVVCSCRFVAGRDMKSCATDKLAGTELVTLVDDEEAKSVTARFPLLSSDTAQYRPGYGCVLESWDK